MEEKLTLQSGVSISLANKDLVVTGPKGKARIVIPAVDIHIAGQDISISSMGKEKVNTTIALVKAAEKGVTEGHKKKLQILYVHFPMTIEIKGKVISIKNFLGEKIPRIAEIVGDTVVKIEKEFITITGPDKYAVGQTAANLRTATHIKQKDPRVFQDGIYPVE